MTSIAGAARHHAAALESDGAGPGSPLELRREPANEHDHDAIAVHLAGDTAWSARVLRESRP